MSSLPSSAPPPPVEAPQPGPFLRFLRLIEFDSDYHPGGIDQKRAASRGVDFPRLLPFLVIHAGCFAPIWVGASPVAVWTAVVLYFVRMFAVTGVNHRYFAHKTYTTSRPFQFILSVYAGTCVQRGSLWWAASHRHHHRHSDHAEDAHSPRLHGFWWAHIGWLTSNRYQPTDYASIPDLAKYPELRWLNRFDQVVPLALAATLFLAGEILSTYSPHLGTTGMQMLVWGFFISTTVLFHGTACINSLAHVIGRRRFATDDDSRNSFILSLITLGEGWHNNHHRYQSSTRNGFYWWEFDPTYYGLKLLSWTGLIWNLKPVPPAVLAEGRRAHATRDSSA